MVASRAILAIAMTMTGIASQYAPGRMESVVEVRRGRSLPHSVNLSEYDGSCAFILPEYIGREILARPVGQNEWERILVVDTAGLADGGLGFMLWGNEVSLGIAEAGYYLSQVRAGQMTPAIPIEVDYNTAVRWDSVGRGIKVEVALLEPIELPRNIR